MGFATCKPADWRVTEGQDAGRSWVQFESPGSDRNTGAGLRYVVASVGPNTTGKDGEEFFSAMGAALFNTYGEALGGKLSGVMVGVDVPAIEGRYATMQWVTETEQVEVVGWEAHFLLGDQHWTVAVVGLAEFRGELGGVHDQFFAGFRPLAP
jgi:hypothetical protein